MFNLYDPLPDCICSVLRNIEHLFLFVSFRTMIRGEHSIISQLKKESKSFWPLVYCQMYVCVCACV